MNMKISSPPFIIGYILLAMLLTSSFSCGKDDDGQNPNNIGSFQLQTALIGTVSLLSSDPKVPAGEELVLGFDTPIDPQTNSAISLLDQANNPLTLTYQNLDNNKIITVTPAPALVEGATYRVLISDELKSIDGKSFPGVEFTFETLQAPLEILSLYSGNVLLEKNKRNVEIPLNPVFSLTLSHDISEAVLQDNLVLVGDINYLLSVSKTGPAQYNISPLQELSDFTKINLLFPPDIGTDLDRPFQVVSYNLYTTVSTIPDFPILTDEELLTLVQSQTFKYFWDFGHPVSGMARERNSSGDLVTSGGTGFGLMAMIVGVERGFITRQQAIERWETMFNFLENADRFHGAWSHWLSGVTGNVIAFSTKDNGGDLVETAFLVQGMLTVRQYLDSNVPAEAALIAQINTLWEGVEWDWYTKGGQQVLYWHWSPQYGWEINHQIRGHNETQIVYTLAAASPTHPIEPSVYHQGYASNGGIQNGDTFYGFELPLGENKGGPLFFTHYSYLGMDPRNLQDDYANYWQQNVNHSLINRAYCIDNPQNFVGYSESCWGLTASDNHEGYSAHSPNNDKGVITPTAAISSIPYTPDESLEAIRHFYYYLGDRLWGEYGFYDAFNPTEGWVADSYLAIDQGPIICMIENYRTGLLWDLYMSAPEVTAGLDVLGFTY
jgi:hypothetical protein